MSLMSKAIKAYAVAVQAFEPVIGWGDPGVGKSQMTRSLALYLQKHAKNWPTGFETFIASQHDPVDIAGQPYVGSNDTLKLAVPDWAQAIIEANGGIVFFDEFTGATPACQNALLTVILDNQVGRTKLPERTARIAMANPPEIAAGGNELSAPLANRFCHLEWEFDHEGWINNYLVGNGAPLTGIPIVPETWRDGIASQRVLVAGFNKGKTTAALMLPKTDVERGKAWPSPRSWDMAARLRAASLASGADKSVEIALTRGCIGEGMAMEFIAWLDAADLPNPEELLADPKAFKVPERGDRTFTILASVSAVVCAKLTRDRYMAAWQIFSAATKSGHKDVATASVVNLVKAAIDKPFLAEEDVRKQMREHMKPFLSILKNAGLAREAA
jgi:hypothetical protein